ncbi:hypothetical protein [Corynebacterium sp.]|uniref:hypothetical protein n=1 Tax=Corynebacterium sp. TaxID=1720 RepID=UPI0025C5CFE7|nr:hypothetical protein [Corynebacterium sp.]
MTNTINAYTRGSARLSGIRAYQSMADTWGVSLDELTTDEYKAAAEKARAFKRFRAAQSAPDLLTFILDNDPNKWSAGMNKIAASHAAAQFAEDNFARVNAALEQRADNMLHNDQARAHVASVLDIDTAQQQVIDAAAALGTKLYDPQKAAIASPQHFAAYMEGIARIVSLDAVLRSRTERAAMFADVPLLTSLKYTLDGFGRRDEHYSRDDVAKHQKAHDWRRHASGDDEVITKLAVGEYAPLTLSVSLDPDVLAKRAARLAGAGATEQI